jgi:hypothetical protein
MSSKEMRLKINLSLIAAAVFLSSGSAKIPPLILTMNGGTEYQIVVSHEASEFDLQAASELQGYIEKSSGIIIPIVTDEAPPKTAEIFVGRSRRLADLSLNIPFEELGDDGFVLKTAGQKLIIAGGREKGTLYGVYTFLEDYLGCRKYSKEVTLVPRQPTIKVGPICRKEVPFFGYREVYMPDAFDDAYADWHKLDNQKVRQLEWGLWVHTFKTFVPPEKYFRDHPEYFTEMNGLRVPDAQLCLTNPAVFKIVVESLREQMREKPEAKYWSVSQNDTFSPCQCPACRILDEKYGGPSGTILDFVNRVAREFPDKMISTLAYQYSRQAPTGIKPEKNVNIMLCTIECNRSRPIASDPQNASFTKDIRDWGKLTDNIILWDYVVQFRNYCNPFPNLRVLKPNINFFKDNGVRLMFQQGSSTSRSEFHDLRTYLIAKLLWNPEADVEALTDDFVNGFYGPAAKHIRRYIRLLHDSLEESAGDLGIYGFPWDGVKTYLRPKLLDKYSRFFNEAQAAVGGNPVFFDRVRFARLPIEFAMLEIAKRQVTPKYSIFARDGNRLNVNPAMVKRLDTFVEWANRFKIMRLEESGTPPDVYREEMRDFMASGMNVHLGFERPARVLTASSEKYPVGGAKALTDGLKGTRDYHCNWLGFEGEEMEAVVDLGKPPQIRSISVDFLQNINAWIWVPESVEYSVSDNGQDFATIGTVERRTGARAAGDIIEEFRCNFQARPARYAKVKTKSFLHCPPWHKGAGGKSWIFADEIVIN